MKILIFILSKKFIALFKLYYEKLCIFAFIFVVIIFFWQKCAISYFILNCIFLIFGWNSDSLHNFHDLFDRKCNHDTIDVFQDLKWNRNGIQTQLPKVINESKGRKIRQILRLSKLVTGKDLHRSSTEAIAKLKVNIYWFFW